MLPVPPEDGPATLDDAPTQGDDPTPEIAFDEDDPATEYDALLAAAAVPAPSGFSFLGPPRQAGDLGTLGGCRVLRLLGVGGLAHVFEAVDLTADHAVALKVMLPEAATDPQARDRFLRAARAVAALRHPHVVAVLRLGQDNGLPFLVMPLLAGEPLETRLERVGRLSVGEAVRIGREMAEGLAAAHAAGIIHRDLKPANVWLEAPDDRVRLLDFGLARSGSSAARTWDSSVAEMPPYTAPEEVEGAADARSDLFALGCLLYEMPTGRQPFAADSVVVIMAGLLVRDPPPHALNPEVPPALSALILELLAERPEDRPPSAEAVVQRLRALETAETNAAFSTVEMPPPLPPVRPPTPEPPVVPHPLPVAPPPVPEAASPPPVALPPLPEPPALEPPPQVKEPPPEAPEQGRPPDTLRHLHFHRSAPDPSPARPEEPPVPEAAATATGSAEARAPVAAGTGGKRLLVIAGKDKGRQFVLPEQGPFPLGRGAAPEARLNDLKVSRNHAVVLVEGNRVLLADTQSRLGTFVALGPDKPFRQVTDPEALEHGAVIRVGDTELQFEDDNLSDVPTQCGTPEDVRRYILEVQARGRVTTDPILAPRPSPRPPQQPTAPPIQVRCTCGQELLAREMYAGERVRCPNCGDFLNLPGRPAVVRPASQDDAEEPSTLTSFARRSVAVAVAAVPRRLLVPAVVALVAVVALLLFLGGMLLVLLL